jgi:hypothetical protein
LPFLCYVALKTRGLSAVVVVGGGGVFVVVTVVVVVECRVFVGL